MVNRNVTPIPLAGSAPDSGDHFGRFGRYASKVTQKQGKVEGVAGL
jgi:hypothetical protein